MIFKNWLDTRPKMLNAWTKCPINHFGGCFARFLESVLRFGLTNKNGEEEDAGHPAAGHEEDLRDVLRLLVLPNWCRCLCSKVETPVNNASRFSSFHNFSTNFASILLTWCTQSHCHCRQICCCLRPFYQNSTFTFYLVRHPFNRSNFHFLFHRLKSLYN